MNQILYKNKKQCCGCEACVNICPVNIIEMSADEEGFYYPYIRDVNKCIQCNQCEKVCPFKNVTRAEKFEEDAYAGYSQYEDDIKSSASGGIASQLSIDFIKKGGVVYGVEYSNDCMEVKYEKAEYIEYIDKFKTSKYIQSRKNHVYSNIKKDIENGKNVLFIGVPCDCYALQLFLKENKNNLYVCSLICHGVSSPSVHKEYCENLVKEKNDLIEKFSVRYKKEGWKPYYIHAKFKHGGEYLERFDKSIYGKAFLYLKRPSCNVCPFKRELIHSDITLGDYHLASGGKEKPYNPWGVSSIVVHTQKGKELLNRNRNIMVEKVPIQKILYSEAYEKAIPAKINRKVFGKVFSKNGIEQACNLNSVKLLDMYNIFKVSVLGFLSRIKKSIIKK